MSIKLYEDYLDVGSDTYRGVVSLDIGHKKAILIIID
jgi:hypothetical protein